MITGTALEPVDYLAIGHITRDIIPQGDIPGGPVLYSALTARALGFRVGIVTACAADYSLPVSEGITILSKFGEVTTTFENIYTPDGRIQILHQIADPINLSNIPEIWRKTPIIHIAPVASETDPSLARYFPDSLVCITPQGFMRAWDQAGNVSSSEWPEAAYVLENSAAAVISIEDINGDESRIEEMLRSIRILAVTEGAEGARIYWNGDVRRFSPPRVTEVDSTGAGDIFAACFFTRYNSTRDPWEAGRFATQLAGFSVTRRGLESLPKIEEINRVSTEILNAEWQI
ncbi:MAG: PfkB family carbohydrate kinase [Leptolinea sp.]